jgi:ribosomal protein L40E
MLKLYDANNLPEAHLLLDLLSQAGIEAQILNIFAQGATGEIPFGQAYPEIWLEDENDKPRALAIIHDYESTPTNTDWVFCRQCGERNPANFELCWQCSKELNREND